MDEIIFQNQLLLAEWAECLKQIKKVGIILISVDVDDPTGVVVLASDSVKPLEQAAIYDFLSNAIKNGHKG